MSVCWQGGCAGTLSLLVGFLQAVGCLWASCKGSAGLVSEECLCIKALPGQQTEVKTPQDAAPVCGVAAVCRCDCRTVLQLLWDGLRWSRAGQRKGRQPVLYQSFARQAVCTAGIVWG